MRDLKEYLRPVSAQEAVQAKQEYGERAVYLGGGSDLLVHRPLGIEVAIDIRHAGMSGVQDDADAHVIGGGALLRTVEATLSTVANGMLLSAVRHTAPWVIRNAATLAGNIANASPAADSVPALLALDAELVLFDGTVRRAAIPEVVVGPHRTTLGNALIAEIRIPQQPVRGVFLKHARSESDIALVNVAVAARLEDGVLRGVRIALGAVAPAPVRATQAEELLEGEQPAPALLAAAAEKARQEIAPIDDHRASAAYRRHIAGVLVRRALEKVSE